MNNLLDTPILHFTENDPFTWADAFTGILVLGAAGSGKTSSSMAMLLREMAKQGAGALICCIKADEADNVTQHIQAIGREQDIIRITAEDSPYRINVLNTLMQGSQPLHQIDEAVAFLSRLQDLLGTNSNSSDEFWRESAAILIRYSLTLLILSQHPITFTSLQAVIRHAPTNREQMHDRYWQQESPFWAMLEQARRHITDTAASHAYVNMEQYFLKEYAEMASKTRASIQLTVLALLDKLLNGLLYELFSTDTTLRLEDSFEGKIILMDLSPRSHGVAGRVAQFILADLWKKAVLARPITTDSKPIFLMVDEAQQLISKLDYTFLAEARSSRAAVIYATQTITNFHSALGTAQHSADALLGLFNTFIFHNNGDPITNQWASNLCGYQQGIQKNFHADMAGNVSLSAHQQRAPIVSPDDFARLKRGGAPSFQSEIIIYKAGRIWSSGETVLRTQLKQQIDTKQTEHQKAPPSIHIAPSGHLLYQTENAEDIQENNQLDHLLTASTYLIEGLITVKNPAYLLRYVLGSLIPDGREDKKRALRTVLHKVTPQLFKTSKTDETLRHTIPVQLSETYYPVPLIKEQVTPDKANLSRFRHILFGLMLLAILLWLFFSSNSSAALA